MSPPRTFLSFIMLRLLTVSSAYPHNTGSDDIEVVEYTTDIDERDFVTATVRDIIKRAAYT